MPGHPTAASSVPRTPPRHTKLVRLVVYTVCALLCVYLLIAYLTLPLVWRRYAKRHPALDDAPRITHTKTGIPGDPLNIALIASEDELHKSLLAAGWFPADPVTLESSLRIAAVSAVGSERVRAASFISLFGACVCGR